MAMSFAEKGRTELSLNSEPLLPTLCIGGLDKLAAVLYSDTMQIDLRTPRLAQYQATIIPLAWRQPADRGFLYKHLLDNIDLEAELVLALTATEVEVSV